MPLSYVFQGGQAKQIVVTATAGNVVTNLTPATGRRWLILRGEIYLSCDVTVANRRIIIQITDGTNIVETFAYSNIVIASGQGTLDFGEGLTLANSAGFGQISTDIGYIGIQPIFLANVEQFRISINAGVAGDAYSARIEVLEAPN